MYSYLNVIVKLCKMTFTPWAGEGFYRATPAVMWYEISVAAQFCQPFHNQGVLKSYSC